MTQQIRRTYSTYLADLVSRLTVERIGPARTNDDVLTDSIFYLGMIALALQVLQIGMAQPAHIWMLLALAVAIFRGKFDVTAREIAMFALFIITALAATYLQGFGRVKALEQLLKFGLIYPGFYVVGRWFGKDYTNRQIPTGYLFLLIMLLAQYLIQTFQIPVLYKEIDFGQGAMHGSFKERAWLSLYFLLLSYALFLQKKSTSAFIVFILFNAAVSFLSGSKSSFVACGIIFIMHGKTSVPVKVLLLLAGAAFYWWLFADSFTSEEIQIRLETERGLAFEYASNLLKGNIFGYGFGFVEFYFAYVAPYVMGLGIGNNAIFCTPLDFMLIAGLVGLAFWLVFFFGLTLQSWTYLLPIAALSLVNPLHGSELVYLFLGIFISQARGALPAKTETITYDLPKPQRSVMLHMPWTGRSAR